MVNKASIVLPTYNEKDNIIKLINEINNYIRNSEIIVVDDDSPDLTWKIAQDSNIKNVKVIRRINNKGLAASIHKGIENTTGDAVIWMDCDLSHPPSLIPKLLESLNENDIAVASRYNYGGKDKRKFIRFITSYIFNLYAKIILGLKIKDTDSGFIAVKKEVFSKVDINPKGYGEYFIEFVYKCQKQGYKIVEVPFIMEDRSIGNSKTGENFLSLLKLGYKYCSEVIKIKLNKQ